MFNFTPGRNPLVRLYFTRFHAIAKEARAKEVYP
jgi:hypothetical protein